MRNLIYILFFALLLAGGTEIYGQQAAPKGEFIPHAEAKLLVKAVFPAPGIKNEVWGAYFWYSNDEPILEKPGDLDSNTNYHHEGFAAVVFEKTFEAAGDSFYLVRLEGESGGMHCHIHYLIHEVLAKKTNKGWRIIWKDLNQFGADGFGDYKVESYGIYTVYSVSNTTGACGGLVSDAVIFRFLVNGNFSDQTLVIDTGGNNTASAECAFADHPDFENRECNCYEVSSKLRLEYLQENKTLRITGNQEGIYQTGKKCQDEEIITRTGEWQFDGTQVLIIKTFEE